MRKKYTLVVIDMQARFKSSDKALLGCLDVIETAKADKASILLLEYDGCGPTLLRITKAIETHPPQLVATAIKNHDDGAKVVLSTCKRKKFPTDRFVVCGVNAEACVLKTVKTLAEEVQKKHKRPRIKVAKNAIASQWSQTNIEEKYSGLKNVVCC